eukprot:3937572-Rhodomonas_salina.1
MLPLWTPLVAAFPSLEVRLRARVDARISVLAANLEVDESSRPRIGVLSELMVGGAAAGFGACHGAWGGGGWRRVGGMGWEGGGAGCWHAHESARP